MEIVLFSMPELVELICQCLTGRFCDNNHQKCKLCKERTDKILRYLFVYQTCKNNSVVLGEG